MKTITVSVTDIEGDAKEYLVRRLGATEGFRLLELLPRSIKGSDEPSKEVKSICYKCIGVEREEGETLWLTTPALVDNHVSDGMQLAQLLAEVVEHNTGFFGRGSNNGFLDLMLQKLVSILTPMLTPYAAQLSAQVSQLIASLETNSTSKKP